MKEKVILPLKFPKPQKKASKGQAKSVNKVTVNKQGLMKLEKPKKQVGEKRAKHGTLEQYKAVCLEIYQERKGKCQECGVFIDEPKYHNFNHTAGRTENFLNKRTIDLLCFSCHSAYGGIPEKNGSWLN